MENENNEVVDLVNQLENSEAQKDIDLFEDLRKTIIKFFQARAGVVTQLEIFRMQISNSLSTQVANNELTFDELLRLYTAVSAQSNDASNSIISIFKPVPGAESILAKTLGNKDDDAVTKFHDSLSPDNLKQLEKLRALLTPPKTEKGVAKK